MSLNELIIPRVRASAWLDGTSDGSEPQGTLGSTPVPLRRRGQHPSPAHPPFPAAGLTSPLGTAFRCGQMVMREAVALGSSPAGLHRAVPLPAGVGTGQGPARWDNNRRSPGDSHQPWSDANRVQPRMDLASSGMRLPLGASSAVVRGHAAPGWLEPRLRCCQGWGGCAVGWKKRGILNPNGAGTHAVQPFLRLVHAPPALPLCHGSRIRPAPLSLNFKLSPPASQQDTPLPRLRSHLPPYPSSSPLTPFIAWGCCPAAPHSSGQRRGAGAGTVPGLEEGPWQREKEPPAATLFGDFAQIPVSSINRAPRQDPGTNPVGAAK